MATLAPAAPRLRSSDGTFSKAGELTARLLRKAYIMPRRPVAFDARVRGALRAEDIHAMQEAADMSSRMAKDTRAVDTLKENSAIMQQNLDLVRAGRRSR